MKAMLKIQVVLWALLMPFMGFSFCGFYVSKADVKLFNKASQVILVRDGDKNVVTMSNDFYGDVKDFAMVVPVPTVLKESDIKVVDRYIFDKLDAYSGPRLVEYHDQNPCYPIYYDMMAMPTSTVMKEVAAMDMANEEVEDLGVTIEASYTIGEYDILILSAEESSGLKTWLNKNNYKIPQNAEEVLDPYIKSNLKFFVVKVNLKNQQEMGFENLRPIQISYESNRFMLPIRLGMANAENTQDLVVYAFSQTGRIETTNYRTTKIPTDKNIPTFVKDNFGQFYKDMYNKTYKRNGRNSVFLEYSWDLSSSNYVKCDPCSTTPPTFQELSDAGVFWVQNGYQNGWGGSNYSGNVFFTRLHVTYDRENFPQDLFFQITPNKESFQGRYIIQNPVQGNLDCEEAANYYRQVVDRRENELDELAYLTGWDISEYDSYVDTYQKKYDRAKKHNQENNTEKNAVPIIEMPNNGGNGTQNPMIWYTLAASLTTLALGLSYFYKRKFQLA